MTEPARQRRGRAIAMTDPEVDEFLTAERTCRLATAGQDGRPHVAPLWFVWDGTSLWLNSVVRSQRWTDLARDPRVAVVIDAGVEFRELRGIELSGTVVPVGDIPRTAGPDPALASCERLFARKYTGHDEFTPDGRHAWLRLIPVKVVSWDFRKVADSSLAEPGPLASGYRAGPPPLVQRQVLCADPPPTERGSDVLMTKRTAEDTLAIQEVVAAYGHAIDDRDWDAFGRLVTDDVVIDYRNHDVEPPAGNGPYRGRDQILAALSGELMKAHPVQHILVSHLLEEVSEDEVIVRSKGLFPIGTDFRVANVGYRIGVRRTPDGWRIVTLSTVAYPRPSSG